MKNYTVVRSLIHNSGSKTITHRTPTVPVRVAQSFLDKVEQGLKDEGYCIKPELWGFIAVRSSNEPCIEYRLG